MIVVMVVFETVSLLFCKAYFRRFERLGLEVSWMDESGSAVDREGYTADLSHSTPPKMGVRFTFDLA